MNSYTYSLALQIFHPSSDLSALFETLSGISEFTPGRIWKAGDPRKTPNEKLLGGNEKESYCYLGIFDPSGLNHSEKMSLSTAIEKAVDRLSSQKEIFLDISQTGGRCRFHIGWHHDSNVGDVFEPKLLNKLAELSLGLWFDVYYYPETNTENHENNSTKK